MAVFAVCGILLTGRLGTPDAFALWAALIPLLVILCQAGTYWLLARTWVGVARMPAALAGVFRGLRIADVVLLVIGLVGVIVWWPANLAVALGVLAVWAFGVIEYLNYFVVRLSYPVTSWFRRVGEARRPQLVQDMIDAV